MVDEATHADQRVEASICEVEGGVEGIGAADCDLVVDCGDGDVHSLVVGRTGEDAVGAREETEVEEEDVEENDNCGFDAETVTGVGRFFEGLEHYAAMLYWVLELGTA